MDDEFVFKARVRCWDGDRKADNRVTGVWGVDNNQGGQQSKQDQKTKTKKQMQQKQKQQQDK
eukprot:m.5701 g.5701  ORF g.5701 m.5701 type:complete len:62 (+) comp5601_c0_seq1:691-876(+)